MMDNNKSTENKIEIMTEAVALFAKLDDDGKKAAINWINGYMSGRTDEALLQAEKEQTAA